MLANGTMTISQDLVFLLDVDNTLLDNDAMGVALNERVTESLGTHGARRYWDCFETLRTELGYADYLGAVQQLYDAALASQTGVPRNAQNWLGIRDFLLEYPYAERLYPQALEAIARLSTFGSTVILTDGDAVFQPHKVRRSGLWESVGGRVLVYVHKELNLDEVQRLYPARHYVIVDDKLRILSAMKMAMGRRLTTVFARQGHNARDLPTLAAYGPADVAIASIGTLVHADLGTWPGLGGEHSIPHSVAHAIERSSAHGSPVRAA
jgi:FMN phosphatase YigB (HAD superfamily)